MYVISLLTTSLREFLMFALVKIILSTEVNFMSYVSPFSLLIHLSICFMVASYIRWLWLISLYSGKTNSILPAN